MLYRDHYRLSALLLTAALTGCGDDGSLTTESASDTSTGTTQGTTEVTPDPTVDPTTGPLPTTGDTTTDTTTMTIDPTTSDTTTTTSDTTTTTSDTTTTTLDTTTDTTTMTSDTTTGTTGDTSTGTTAETTGTSTTGEPDACENGVQDDEETDIDCGGPACGPCADGGACLEATDCQSGVCEALVCAEPSCDDGVQNGDETGLDCGGSCDECAEQTLVINEIDYDQPGNDAAEFVEILNVSAAPVSLDGIALVLVNGSSGLPYTTVDLAPAGALMPGQYLVVGPAGLAVPPDALKVDFPVASNAIQNGDPDGVALVDTQAALLLDALSYEGVTMAQLPGVGAVSLVEGTALVAIDSSLPDSLGRLPDGTDTNNADSDWALNTAPTPGLANAP